MAKQETKKPKRIQLLEIRKVKIEKGERAGQTVPVVQFAKDIEITWKGQLLDLGEYRSLFIKQREELVADLEYLVENNHIDQDRYESQLARLEDKNVTAGLQVPLK